MSETCFDSKIKIVQGEKKIITVKILDANDVGQDLTGVTLAQAAFPLKNCNYLKKRSDDAVDPVEIILASSNVRITLGPTETAQLKAGTGQTFYVSIDFPGALGRKVVKLENRFDVLEAPEFAA